MYAYICIYMYTFIHVYIYTCICIYICMSWMVANLERVKWECGGRVNGYVDRGVRYIGCAMHRVCDASGVGYIG